MTRSVLNSPAYLTQIAQLDKFAVVKSVYVVYWAAMVCSVILMEIAPKASFVAVRRVQMVPTVVASSSLVYLKTTALQNKFAAMISA